METMLAWVGEDELGSGEVGIKRLGLIGVRGYLEPLVLLEGQEGCLEKLTPPEVVAGLQRMADHYKHPIRLVRFREVETVLELQPRPERGGQ